ncbi:hypothetical protein BCR39DRAFT_527796 [Naematelia encephala]|uniref:GDP-Man:Man(3)GlcNAc(2)-PP-Dol alpha-1,2-mannosyltransferase n=1 Tax=Naematelia encephala TaxID=71784 RepID=A0A1Y2B957_9TREE|nr:hypothetical protein BCR39DRAFT_527796 [Naematelia encephala]
MAIPVVIAYAIFASYFGLIGLNTYYVFKSILKGKTASDLFTGRPFFFLRTAFGALLCTWYFMFKFMRMSYNTYLASHLNASMGTWLQNTALFEQAWSAVCRGPANWWWSSFICTWTVLFTAVVWIESGRRGIKYPWAYMLFGQLVAMSVATSLFLTALYLHPVRHPRPSPSILVLAVPLLAALATIYRTSSVVQTDGFLPNLLAMHALLVVPLLFPPPIKPVSSSAPAKASSPQGSFSSGWLYVLVTAVGTAIHAINTKSLLDSIPPHRSVYSHLWRTVFSHPAQASVSFDVLWVALTIATWFLVSGSTIFIVLKATAAVAIATLGLVSYTGINWTMLLSIVPGTALLAFGLAAFGIENVRSKNVEKRKKLLDSLGASENAVIPGTKDEPPSMSGKRTVIGFWHPYCNAGGGGERVLWTAIAQLQKRQSEVIILVYSGDYPKASKEEIIDKVHERFSISLNSSTLAFVPLASRHLISDGYWPHFTLLGQSLGSLYLAYEGLAGAEGLWGDVFLDSMGYAFTFPFVRFLAGPQIAIGAYIHYPTVSADMVKRVRAGSFGVENLGGSRSWLRTQVKLLYYRIFTTLYANALLFSEETMTNSSWTQAHIQHLVALGRKSLLAGIILKDNKSVAKAGASAVQCRVVYPPCDTGALTKLGRLDDRKRVLVSLAQFRPEKEHWKQIQALSELFKSHPEYRDGPKRISLTLMGGVRDETDEARVGELRALAEKLDVEDNVEFLVNAPYPEIVRRLGEASIGLNTMQDEHFGINVVEFMAAGLIPIVHASAGPKMDIVVPFHGQRTGYQATTPSDFAEAIHSALSLPIEEQLRMRKAARGAAVDRFSESGFGKGFIRSWDVLKRLAEDRR